MLRILVSAATLVIFFAFPAFSHLESVYVIGRQGAAVPVYSTDSKHARTLRRIDVGQKLWVREKRKDRFRVELAGKGGEGKYGWIDRRNVSFIPPGHCAITFAARRSVQEILEFSQTKLSIGVTLYQYIQASSSSWGLPLVLYGTESGWITLSHTPQPIDEAEKFMARLRKVGGFPDDMYCTTNSNFVSYLYLAFAEDIDYAVWPALERRLTSGGFEEYGRIFKDKDIPDLVYRSSDALNLFLGRSHTFKIPPKGELLPYLKFDFEFSSQMAPERFQDAKCDRRNFRGTYRYRDKGENDFSGWDGDWCFHTGEVFGWSRLEIRDRDGKSPGGITFKVIAPTNGDPMSLDFVKLEAINFEVNDEDAVLFGEVVARREIEAVYQRDRENRAVTVGSALNELQHAVGSAVVDAIDVGTEVVKTIDQVVGDEISEYVANNPEVIGELLTGAAVAFAYQKITEPELSDIDRRKVTLFKYNKRLIVPRIARAVFDLGKRIDQHSEISRQFSELASQLDGESAVCGVRLRGHALRISSLSDSILRIYRNQRSQAQRLLDALEKPRMSGLHASVVGAVSGVIGDTEITQSVKDAIDASNAELEALRDAELTFRQLQTYHLDPEFQALSESFTQEWRAAQKQQTGCVLSSLSASKPSSPSGNSPSPRAIPQSTRSAAVVVPQSPALSSEGVVLTDPRTWVGKTVRGQIISNDKRWYAELRTDGTVTFQPSSGNRQHGRYSIRNGTICFEYNASGKEACRTPRRVGSEIRWYDEKGEYGSRIVLVDSSSMPSAQQRTSSVARHIEGERCALVVSSQKTVEQARAYVRRYIDADKRAFLMGYQSNNGWIAVSIGTLAPQEVHPILSRWKASGRIPHDSYCSHGHRYLHAVNIK